MGIIASKHGIKIRSGLESAYNEGYEKGRVHGWEGGVNWILDYINKHIVPEFGTQPLSEFEPIVKKQLEIALKEYEEKKETKNG